MLLIPTLSRQRQVDLCKFKARLVYIVLGQARLHRKTLSQNKNTTKLS